MKLSLALLPLLLTGISITASQALVDQRSMENSVSEHRSPPLEKITVAQADEKDDETSYQQILDAFLERDDFAAAKDFVDGLSKDAGVPPAALRSLRNQIISVKTTRLISYAEKIRQAIAKSDMDTVNEYSERMQRLRTDTPANTPKADEDVEIGRSEPTSRESESVREIQDDEAIEESKSRLTAEEAIAVRQMQAALEEGRFFPPATDNAFDLASARLNEKPNDPDTLNLLDNLINEQQSKVLASLDFGQPEEALKLTDQLIEAVERLEADTSASSNGRLSALRWAEQIRPDIVAGLIAGTEQAMGRWSLTIAPEGKLSAEGYVDLLATELGPDHAEVQRLANEIVDRYQSLIDYRLNRRQYDRASTFQGRMQAVAERFGLPTDQIAELGRYIQALPARQRQHDQLLQQAAEWRGQGQLVEPAGANALESAASAVRLAVDPETAGKVYNDVIFEQRKRIDRLIDTSRLEEAARQLRQLGTAVEQIDASQSDRASEYYAEADRVLERAAREKERQRAEKAKKAKPVAAAPPEPAAEPDDAPFTFINPF